MQSRDLASQIGLTHIYPHLREPTLCKQLENMAILNKQAGTVKGFDFFHP